MGECIFELNRYKSEQFLSEWKIVDKSTDIVEINDVEIELDQGTTELLIQNFFYRSMILTMRFKSFAKETMKKARVI